MATFETAEELHAKVGGVFQDAVTDEVLFAKLQKVDSIVRVQTKAPDGQVTFRAVADKPGIVEVGPSRLNPEVILRTDGDTVHGWLSGEVNPTVALSKGTLRATGPVEKILRVVTVIPALAEQYKLVVENGGRVTEAPAPAVEEPAAADEAPAEAPAAEAPAADEPPAEPVAETAEAVAEATDATVAEVEAVVEEVPAVDEVVESTSTAEEIVESVPAAEELVEDAPSVEEILETAPAAEEVVAEAPVAEEVVEAPAEPEAEAETTD